MLLHHIRMCESQRSVAILHPSWCNCTVSCTWRHRISTHGTVCTRKRPLGKENQGSPVRWSSHTQNSYKLCIWGEEVIWSGSRKWIVRTWISLKWCVTQLVRNNASDETRYVMCFFVGFHQVKFSRNWLENKLFLDSNLRFLQQFWIFWTRTRVFRAVSYRKLKMCFYGHCIEIFGTVWNFGKKETTKTRLQRKTSPQFTIFSNIWLLK